MAVAFDTVTSIALNDAPETFSHTCNGDDRLLIVITTEWRGDSTSRVTAITYDGVSLTKLDQAFNTGLVSLWYLVNPASGANDVVITNGGLDSITVVISMTGAHQTSTFGTLVKDEASNLAPSVTLTSAVDELCIDALAIFITSVHTVTGGQDLRGHLGVGNSHGASSTELGATSVVMSYTTSVDTRRAFLGVPVKAAPAAVNKPNQRLLKGIGA